MKQKKYIPAGTKIKFDRRYKTKTLTKSSRQWFEDTTHVASKKKCNWNYKVCFRNLVKLFKFAFWMTLLCWFFSTIEVSNKPFEEQKVEASEPVVETFPKVYYSADPVVEKDLFKKYFKPEDARIMKAICEAENTSKDPKAIGDKHLTFKKNGQTYGMSVGLCQIRIMPDRGITVEQMQDPEHNIEYASHLFYKTKSGFKHWTMYNNGRYQKYLK